MNESVRAQVRTIHRVVDLMSSAQVKIWLFGGWGLDARIGRITRPPRDIEFWVESLLPVRSVRILACSTASRSRR